MDAASKPRVPATSAVPEQTSSSCVMRGPSTVQCAIDGVAQLTLSETVWAGPSNTCPHKSRWPATCSVSAGPVVARRCWSSRD